MTLLPELALTGAAADDVVVTGTTHDSHQVMPGDLYAALPGSHRHGSEFVSEAVSAGAVAVPTDPHGCEAAERTGLPVVVADDVRGILGPVARWVYGDPSAALTVVGITGT